MGMVYADIELINTHDIEMERRGHLDRDEIKRMWVRMMADSGSYMLAINENIQEVLQLRVLETKRFQLADGQVLTCNIVGPVDLRFANRECTCRAIVLPGDSEPLLGAIPMEEMDVIIHPQRQELIVHPDHPDYALLRL
jgi:hypothetical protein